jgi:hypothetical protein
LTASEQEYAFGRLGSVFNVAPRLGLELRRGRTPRCPGLNCDDHPFTQILRVCFRHPDTPKSTVSESYIHNPL